MDLVKLNGITFSEIDDFAEQDSVKIVEDIPEAYDVITVEDENGNVEQID